MPVERSKAGDPYWAEGLPMLDSQKLGENTVVVFRTLDETAAAVAKSILEEAGISCMVKGGFMSDVTGISRLGTMFTSGAEPVEVYVLESDAVEASSRRGYSPSRIRRYAPEATQVRSSAARATGSGVRAPP